MYGTESEGELNHKLKGLHCPHIYSSIYFRYTDTIGQGSPHVRTIHGNVTVTTIHEKDKKSWDLGDDLVIRSACP
jgi:hypothetical protein